MAHQILKPTSCSVQTEVCGYSFENKACSRKLQLAYLRLVLLLTVALLFSACGAEEEARPGETASDTSAAAQTAEVAGAALPYRNVKEDVAFVGDAVCFDCHEDLWRGYQQHGMARSYYPLTPENAVEDFSGKPLRHEASDFYYRVFEDDGRFYQEEYRLDASGNKTHRLVRRMDFVVGSGHAARTYLAESNGRLYELPLTWYTQAARWDFSPGYTVQNKRFDRLIPDRCMACHNSYPETVPFVEGKYKTVPNGIGCERCHGPGALHVDERLASPEAPGAVDSTIVNPIHLDLDRQLDVCQQCHLHGSVSVLREGRGPFDYRPAEPLAAYMALFSTDVPRANGEISVISHADRMKQSACFLATRGQANAMTCVTCHNPHEGFRDRGPAYFNETCLECHTPERFSSLFATEAARGAHTATANCIACHMPRVAAEEAPHSSFTDHWIRVVKQEPDVPPPVAAHAPPLEPYFDRDKTTVDGQIYEGMAYVILGKQQADSLAYEKGIAVLEEALAGQPDHGEAHFLLGLAYSYLGRVEEAIPPMEEAIRLEADIPERLNALAQVYEAARRDPVKIGRLYRRALALEPALADVRVNYGRFLETQGRLDEALEQYQQAAEEKPWLPAAFFNLGTAYLQKGAFADAEAALLQALELEPDYPKALSNLGLLYANQNQTEKARVYFERAVAVAPDDPTALGNLGTYYLNQGDLARAVGLLSRAVEADPVYLDGWLNLAVAHFRNDAMDQAAQAARRALEIDPANPTARQILGAL